MPDLKSTNKRLICSPPVRDNNQQRVPIRWIERQPLEPQRGEPRLLQAQANSPQRGNANPRKKLRTKTNASCCNSSGLCVECETGSSLILVALQCISQREVEKEQATEMRCDRRRGLAILKPLVPDFNPQSSEDADKKRGVSLQGLSLHLSQSWPNVLSRKSTAVHYICVGSPGRVFFCSNTRLMYTQHQAKKYPPPSKKQTNNKNK